MPQQITELLIDWNNGSPEALEKLLPMVERELRRSAIQLISARGTITRQVIVFTNPG